MESENEIAERDMQTLARIARGPGNYATPSPERVERLLRLGLVVKKARGTLRPTLKGRFIAWVNKSKT